MADSHRDSRGRFRKGNGAAKGNHGGRPKTYATEYADELREGLTLDAWRKIVDKAVEQALAGDHRAREWLGSYLMGKPIQMIAADVSGTQDRLLEIITELRAALPEVD